MMATPPEAKLYNFQLHRYTLWTVGCGLLLVGGITFVSGALVGAWFALRPAPQPATAEHSVEGASSPATSSPATSSPDGTIPAPNSPANGGTASSTPGSGLVRGPTATAPGVTAPAVRGPTLSSRGITGPAITGPRTSGPRVQGPRAVVPTTSTGTAGGQRLGGGQVRAPATGTSTQQATPANGDATTAAQPPTGTQPPAGAAQPTAADPNPAIALALQDLAEQPPPPPSYQYAIQVGLFLDKKVAQTVLDELVADGHQPYIVTLRSETRRVAVRSLRLGPWASRLEAEEAAANFRADTRAGAAVVRELVVAE